MATEREVDIGDAFARGTPIDEAMDQAASVMLLSSTAQQGFPWSFGKTGRSS